MVITPNSSCYKNWPFKMAVRTKMQPSNICSHYKVTRQIRSSGFVTILWVKCFSSPYVCMLYTCSCWGIHIYEDVCTCVYIHACGHGKLMFFSTCLLRWGALLNSELAPGISSVSVFWVLRSEAVTMPGFYINLGTSNPCSWKALYPLSQSP